MRHENVVVDERDAIEKEQRKLARRLKQLDRTKAAQDQRDAAHEQRARKLEEERDLKQAGMRQPPLRRHRNDGAQPLRSRPRPRDGPCGKEYLWLAGLDVEPIDQAPVLSGARPPPAVGRGTESYGRGTDSYTGAFRRGRKHGQGTMRWSDGREYVGSWKEGHRCGMGRLTKHGTLVYEGQWREGTPAGRGTMVSPDGGQYRGEVQAGRRHGSGLYTTHDGRLTYEGRWRLGRCHGKGTLLFASGVTLEGEWHEGRLHGEAVLTRPSEKHERVQIGNRLAVQLQAASTVREAKSQLADQCGIDVTRVRLHDAETGKEMDEGTTMRQARLQDDDSLGVLAKVPFIELPEGRPVMLRGLKETKTTHELAQKIAEAEHAVNIHGYFALHSETERMTWKGKELDTNKKHKKTLENYEIRKGAEILGVVDSVSVEGRWSSSPLDFKIVNSSRASPTAAVDGDGEEGMEAAVAAVVVLEGELESDDGSTYQYEIDSQGRLKLQQEVVIP
jgi:hypothetical protein